MKLKLLLIPTLIFTLYCCDSPIVKEPEKSVDPIIELPTDDKLILTENGGSKTVTFTTNEDWAINIAKTRTIDWITVSPMSGKAGSATLTVTTLKNETYDDRNANIIINAGSVQKMMTVSQKKKDAIILSDEKQEFDQNGGEFALEVKSNITFDVIIPNECSSWITCQSKSRSLSPYNFNITIAENNNHSNREGKVIIKDKNSDLADTVHIYQTQKNALILTKNKYNIPYTGDKITVELKSNISYNVIIPDNAKSWVTLKPSARDLVTDNITFVVSPNNDYDNRTALITIKDKNSPLSETLTINQIQKNALIITQKEYLLDGKNSILEVELQTNISNYEVIIPTNNWIRGISTKALITDKLTFQVDKNEDRNERSISITFKDKSSDISESINILQYSNKKGIYDTVDFINFANEINKNESSKNEVILNRYGKYNSTTQQWEFWLMADINLNPNITISNSGIVSGSITNGWTPVGSRENPFNGFFDGKNFAIRGLIISTDYLYSGLFGYADDRAIFKNINISDGRISNTLNGSSTGAICGYSNGLVDNCTNQAFLDIKCNESASGGICGLNDGVVKNSTNWGQVYVSGNNSKAGGFVGINNKTIDNCINNGFIVAQDYVWGYVGGICGLNNDYGAITNSVNKAKISVLSSTYTKTWAGGICGVDEGPAKEEETLISIGNCYNTGDVDMTNNNLNAGSSGGIVGWHQSSTNYIVACYNTGNISSALSGSYLQYTPSSGGICGQGNCIIACYNSGTISSASGNSGGIVGEVYADLGTYACYNIGMTSGSYTGGICGYAYNISKYPYSFWLENFGSGLTGNRKESTGEVNINEMQNIANELNDRIIEWNQNNPLAKCEYQFYNIAGDYPKLRKTFR